MDRSRRRRPIFVFVVAILVCATALTSLFWSCSSQRASTKSDAAQTQTAFPIGQAGLIALSRKANSFFTSALERPDLLAISLVKQMPLEQKVAQLFFVTPEDVVRSKTDATVTAFGDTTKECLSERPVGGIIYFQSNLESEGQTFEMLHEVQDWYRDTFGIPLLLGVDEEGGTVSRIGANPGFSLEDMGDMRDMGATGNTELARQAAENVASYLAQLGFTCNLAPVADVADNPASDVMARRSFGADKDLVARMVAAQVEAYSMQGITSCAKHFPGIGAATGDSHDGLIHTDKSLDELFDDELVPFQAAIDARVPMVMVGHIACPGVTGDDTPASLSPTIMDELLRNQIGFEGVIITDSLQMGAVSGDDCGSIAVRSFLAGADALLMPSDFDAAYDAVLAACKNGEISQTRLDLSVYRIVRMKLVQQQSAAAA